MIAAFTGHRPQGLPWGVDETDERCLAVRYRIRSVICDMVCNGCDTFLSGMALGFDTMAAEQVAFMRDKFQLPIRLVGVPACINHTKGWTENCKARYDYITGCLCDEALKPRAVNPSRECFLERDRELVRRADILMACLNQGQQRGGTAYTVKLALKKGIPVVWINPETAEVSVMGDKTQETLF